MEHGTKSGASILVYWPFQFFTDQKNIYNLILEPTSLAILSLELLSSCVEMRKKCSMEKKVLIT